jgi:hypothetical protein
MSDFCSASLKAVRLTGNAGQLENDRKRRDLLCDRWKVDQGGLYVFVVVSSGGGAEERRNQ